MKEYLAQNPTEKNDLEGLVQTIERGTFYGLYDEKYTSCVWLNEKKPEYDSLVRKVREELKAVFPHYQF